MAFKSCAITTSIIGADDDHIHCFKEGQPCEAGKQLLEDEMKNFRKSIEDDPFASDEDEEEEDNNELPIEEDDDQEEDSASDKD